MNSLLRRLYKNMRGSPGCLDLQKEEGWIQEITWTTGLTDRLSVALTIPCDRRSVAAFVGGFFSFLLQVENRML